MEWSIYPNFTIDSDESDLKYECVIPSSEYKTLFDRAVFQKSVRWPLHYTIKVKFLNGDNWQIAWVKKVVDEQISPIINPNLFITFVEPNDYADVKIKFVYDGTYGGSLIGTQCRVTGQNETSMKLGGNMLDYPFDRQFTYQGKIYKVPDSVQGEHPDPQGNGSVIKHEFGHVFGKWHEHQNPINNPIEWNIPKTLDKYMNEPPPWTREEVYKNVIDKLPLVDADATSFDPSSIMMYKVSSHLTLSGVGFNRNYDYSPLDIEWLKSHSFDPNMSLDEFNASALSKINWFYVALFVLVVICGMYLYVRHTSVRHTSRR
jgi:hypothetical protein